MIHNLGYWPHFINQNLSFSREKINIGFRCEDVLTRQQMTYIFKGEHTSVWWQWIGVHWVLMIDQSHDFFDEVILCVR